MEYDWNRIKNVEDYVNKMCEDPQYAKKMKRA